MEHDQPSDRISLSPGCAKRTYTTNRGGGARSENCAFSSHFPGKPRGQRVAGGSSSAGDPPLHHPRFLSLLAPSQGLFSLFTLFFFFFFFSLLSPRERKHREAGGESGLRTRGARAASNARVGSCPYMFDVLLITNFFALTSEYY